MTSKPDVQAIPTAILWRSNSSASHGLWEVYPLHKSAYDYLLKHGESDFADEFLQDDCKGLDGCRGIEIFPCSLELANEVIEAQKAAIRQQRSATERDGKTISSLLEQNAALKDEVSVAKEKHRLEVEEAIEEIAIYEITNDRLRRTDYVLTYGFKNDDKVKESLSYGAYINGVYTLTGFLAQKLDCDVIDFIGDGFREVLADAGIRADAFNLHSLRSNLRGDYPQLIELEKREPFNQALFRFIGSLTQRAEAAEKKLAIKENPFHLKYSEVKAIYHKFTPSRHKDKREIRQSVDTELLYLKIESLQSSLSAAQAENGLLTANNDVLRSSIALFEVEVKQLRDAATSRINALQAELEKAHSDNQVAQRLYDAKVDEVEALQSDLSKQSEAYEYECQRVRDLIEKNRELQAELNTQKSLASDCDILLHRAASALSVTDYADINKAIRELQTNLSAATLADREIEFAKLVFDQNNIGRNDGWSSTKTERSYVLLDEMVRLGYLEKHPTRQHYRWTASKKPVCLMCDGSGWLGDDHQVCCSECNDKALKPPQEERNDHE